MVTRLLLRLLALALAALGAYRLLRDEVRVEPVDEFREPWGDA